MTYRETGYETGQDMNHELLMAKWRVCISERERPQELVALLNVHEFFRCLKRYFNCPPERKATFLKYMILARKKINGEKLD